MGELHSQNVCLNGHQESFWGEASAVDSLGFCEECGSKMINSCPNCNSIIKGYEEVDGMISFGPQTMPVPKYCGNCGEAYPWTASAIESANELIDLSELSEQDKESFKGSIPALIVDTPKTQVAAAKFKIFTAKAGKLVGNGLRDIIVDIASETAKRAIWQS